MIIKFPDLTSGRFGPSAGVRPLPWQSADWRPKIRMAAETAARTSASRDFARFAQRPPVARSAPKCSNHTALLNETWPGLTHR